MVINYKMQKKTFIILLPKVLNKVIETSLLLQAKVKMEKVKLEKVCIYGLTKMFYQNW